MYLALGTLICWLTTVGVHHLFLQHNELKSDLVVLSDPFLDLLPTVDVSTIITFTTFSKIGFLIWHCLQQYWDKQIFDSIVLAGWSCIFMLLLRTTCMYFVPLKVHPKNIPIRDVILDRFLRHEGFKNDLFFSGHLGHCLIIAHVTQNNIFYLVAIIISVCMLLSKTHYCIDLFISPFIIYWCIQGATFICDFFVS